MIGMRSLELSKLRHRSAPQESSRVPKSPHRSAHPKGGIGFDDVDDALLESVCASGDERRRLLARSLDAEHALSGPTRSRQPDPTRRIARTRICTGQRATTSSRCRAIYGPTRPGPPLSSALGGILLGRLCCTSVLDTRFVRNSLFADKSLLSCGAHDSVSWMLAT